MVVRALQRVVLVVTTGGPAAKEDRAEQQKKESKTAFAFFSSVEAAGIALEALRARELFQAKTAHIAALSNDSQGSGSKGQHIDFARFSSHFIQAGEGRGNPACGGEDASPSWTTTWHDDETGHDWQPVDPEAKCQIWQKGWPLPLPNPGREKTEGRPPSHQQAEKSQASSEKHKKAKVPPAPPILGGKLNAAHNIAHWGRKQEELHGVGLSTVAATKSSIPAASAPMQPTAPSISTTSQWKSIPPSTTLPSSAPSVTSHRESESFTDPDPAVLACYLCSRRFKTPTQLAKHEAQSELHRGNLADESKRAEGRERKREARDKDKRERKEAAQVEGEEPSAEVAKEAQNNEVDCASGEAAAAIVAPSVAPPQPQYRDRALERRVAFGIDESALSQAKRAKRHHQQDRTFHPGPPAPTACSAAQPEPEPQPASGRALDDSNVGHAMLRAMGWEIGRGLGEGEKEGRAEPVEAVLGFGGEERAGIGATRRVEETTLPVGVAGIGMMQGSMLDQARGARRRRYEEIAAGEGEGSQGQQR
ncbi:hypothetical protein BDZ90DRAFT_259961 [Jaminaea rosea]|uniref:G-patch domain-containing protein n=1 Tax=Jaminaea rosea TaxID=1569628 RepID=A0A316US75_9BASI|nr:hypothetical protein BDZ90DRAFT_259961 [Jaminaea rosea]PWN28137.1 hypothetical protein BDZ90DRAFT_259961 [Jaminaea rosea]